MYYTELLLLLIALVEHSSAQIKSCSKETESPRVCSKGVYNAPNCTVLDTMVFLEEVVDINVNEKSVSLQMALFSSWRDSGIYLSNETEKDGYCLRFNYACHRGTCEPFSFQNTSKMLPVSRQLSYTGVLFVESDGNFRFCSQASD